MPTVIAIEAKPVEFEGIESGYLHLYLVKTVTDSQGKVLSEKLIRGGYSDDLALVTLADVDLATSPDRRGSDTPEERYRTVLNLGSRNPDDVWSIMVQHAENIERADLLYSLDIFQELPGPDLNSNSVVASVLYSVGIDVIKKLPSGISRSDVPLVDQLGQMKVDDTLLGTAGRDHIRGGVGNDHISGRENSDILYGDEGDDYLSGYLGRDTLSGGSGDDRLYGSWGNDILRGGDGKDAFVFFKKANSTTNCDIIRDFSVADDTVWLDNRIYKDLGSDGTLRAAAFWTGAEAHDATDRIIYDRDDGVLYYDRDGTGEANQVAFAKLTVGLKMTYADFQVI
jgi:Ca2+-binding RTX toxin-like protein